MFRVSQHPSSGVLKTVTAASSTGHNTGTATSLQRGLIGTGLCESHTPVTGPVLEAVVTVVSTPEDGCCDTRNMYSDFAEKSIYLLLHLFGFLLTLNYDARTMRLKSHDNI